MRSGCVFKDPWPELLAGEAGPGFSNASDSWIRVGTVDMEHARFSHIALPQR
jgi:hypothetical protein